MSGVIQIKRDSLDRNSGSLRLVHILGDRVAEASLTAPPASSWQDNEGIRWYLEEYLLYPFDPAPEYAAKVEQSMKAIGAELFSHVFGASQESKAIWSGIRGTIAETTFEISEPGDDSTFWELMQSPLETVPLSCAAKSFVRTSNRDKPSSSESTGPSEMRVLMVIARPGGAHDVRFRSVASRVLHRLSDRTGIELEVLRPPTFDALERKLRAARAKGKPYRVVHFDGHGVFEDLFAKYTGGPSADPRGYLLFESADTPGKPDYIDGERLACLFVECGVHISLLNSCRSARTELSATPGAEDTSGPVKSLGSLAGELIQGGVPAVVAMRYNIWVDTAAQFVAGIYDKLVDGEILSHAFTQARLDLLNNARRTAVGTPRYLQDWMVPLLFESRPAAPPLIPATEVVKRVDVTRLPSPPGSGFVGRDRSFLELDRTFQSESLVCLWGQVGSGKTSTAVEFGRWLTQTGGTKGEILFTTFREHPSLNNVLNEAATVCKHRFEAGGIEWLALDSERRAQVLAACLCDSECFWIWDNVESTGESGWSVEEMQRLREFLERAASGTTKFLLTSRDPSPAWFPQRMVRHELPAMDAAERLELAVAIAGQDISFPQPVWKPLFDFSAGNPYVLSLLVRQALARQIDSREAMDAFLNELHSHGREDIFGSAVQSALQAHFSASELAVLSLCSLCESSVNARLLDSLIDTAEDEAKTIPAHLPAGSSRCEPLLQRAATAGVLNTLGSGYYGIHPGLSSYFQRIFEVQYSPERRSIFEHRYVYLFAAIARVFAKSHEQGDPQQASTAIETLRVNGPNLKLALLRARRQMRWSEAANLLRGFRVLYAAGDHWSEFSTLLYQVYADFIDPQTDKALPGREDFWGTIQGYRVDVLVRARRLREAEQFQQRIVDQGNALLRSPDRQNENWREHMHAALAGQLQELATIQKELGSKQSIQTFEKALEYAQRSGDTHIEGLVAYQIALAYMQTEQSEMESAAYWLAYALDLSSENDPVGRGTILSGLGGHAWMQANSDRNSNSDRARWLSQTIRYFEQALDILPSRNVEARAACHSNLGLALFSQGGDLTRSVQSFQQSISDYDSIGNYVQVGTIQLNLARVLDAGGDLVRCRMFADAALKTFASLAPDAENELVEAQEFIEEIGL